MKYINEFAIALLVHFFFGIRGLVACRAVSQN